MKNLTARAQRPGLRLGGSVQTVCNVLSIHLGIPSIERWAAPLVNLGLLPGTSGGFTTSDAAILLLTVMGAPDPSRAEDRAFELADALLVEIWEVSDTDTGQRRVRFDEQALLAQPVTASDCIAMDLEEMVLNASDGGIEGITVRQDTVGVVIKYARAKKQHFLTCYGAPLEDVPPLGLGVSVSASAAVLRSLVSAMDGQVRAAMPAVISAALN